MNKKSNEERPKTFTAVIALLFLALCVLALFWDLGKGRMQLSQQAEPAEETVSYEQQQQENQPVNDGQDEISETPEADGENDPTISGTESDDEADRAQYFASMRLEREQARGKELNMLENIIADEHSSPAALEDAEKRRLAISQNMENEAAAESLLKTKGYGETVVMLQTDGATVIVDTEIDSKDAAVIADTVDQVSGCGFTNVIIVKR